MMGNCKGKKRIKNGVEWEGQPNPEDAGGLLVEGRKESRMKENEWKFRDIDELLTL
jgi:hypothetical protein